MHKQGTKVYNLDNVYIKVCLPLHALRTGCNQNSIFDSRVLSVISSEITCKCNTVQILLFCWLRVAGCGYTGAGCEFTGCRLRVYRFQAIICGQPQVAGF